MLKVIKKILKTKKAPKKITKKKITPKKNTPKKTIKKKVARNVTKKKKEEKPIGKVTHYFGKIKVAVIKFNKDVRVGKKVAYRGATTDFSDTISSIQKDHVPVKIAKKGSSVGVKVKKKVRVDDRVYDVK